MKCQHPLYYIRCKACYVPVLCRQCYIASEREKMLKNN
jgi:hypothetical protein